MRRKRDEPFEGGHCMNEAELLEYALDGMDGRLRAIAKAHLVECDECREQVAQLIDLHQGMVSTVSLVDPPKGLRKRVLAQLKRR